MIVVDASALTEMLVDRGPLGPAVRRELREDLDWCAPDHVTAEVFSAIRGSFLGRRVTEPQARRALAQYLSFGVRTLDTVPFVMRMWELRNNVSGYDAAYVAAAERHACALVTTDRRLASVPGLRCEVRVVTP